MLTQREIIACCSRSKEKEPKTRKDRYETTYKFHTTIGRKRAQKQETFADETWGGKVKVESLPDLSWKDFEIEKRKKDFLSAKELLLLCGHSTNYKAGERKTEKRKKKVAKLERASGKKIAEMQKLQKLLLIYDSKGREGRGKPEGLNCDVIFRGNRENLFSKKCRQKSYKRRRKSLKTFGRKRGAKFAYGDWREKGQKSL